MAIDWVLDWSGVVSNDFLITLESANNILRHFGAEEISPDEFRRGFKKSSREYWEQRGYDRGEVWRLHEEFLRSSARKPEAIPGVVDAVRKLRNCGSVTVFSAHPELELLSDIFRYGLQYDINYAFGSAKKDTTNDFGQMLQFAGIKKENVIYADDTIEGIILAHNAGIRGVAVVHPEYGYQARDLLEKYPLQPSLGYVTHISQLVEIAKRL